MVKTNWYIQVNAPSWLYTQSSVEKGRKGGGGGAYYCKLTVYTVNKQYMEEGRSNLLLLCTPIQSDAIHRENLVTGLQTAILQNQKVFNMCSNRCTEGHVYKATLVTIT